jgi:hypothetical protein
LWQPAPPPAPTQQLITRDGIVKDLEKKIQTSTEETVLGTDDSPFDDWNGR